MPELWPLLACQAEAQHGVQGRDGGQVQRHEATFDSEEAAATAAMQAFCSFTCQSKEMRAPMMCLPCCATLSALPPAAFGSLLDLWACQACNFNA